MQDPRISVMQAISGLALGGAERMAVNIANTLPRDRFRVYLCSTREEGPLADQISQDVGRLILGRKSRMSELIAMYRFAKFVREHEIRLIHCHASSIFFCALASLICPSVTLVWHDHYGGVAARPRWLYWIAMRKVSAVIACKDELATWAKNSLGMAEDRVFYIRNFVTPGISTAKPDLPAAQGARVVCVANMTPQKDIVNLIESMSYVVKEIPEVQALVIGGQPDLAYLKKVEQAIADNHLERSVFLLGTRQDVREILPNCDIGVLSSESEGLPLALIEYGMAGLACVVTNVGQCADVLGNGQYGIVVPRRNPKSLAAGIVTLLRSDSQRDRLGRAFQGVTNELYSPDQNIHQIVGIYDTALGMDSVAG